MVSARGYIASGEFNGNRVPQHIQNQIVKHIATQTLKFVCQQQNIGSIQTDCHLWAALKEGQAYVFFITFGSLLKEESIRKKVYKYCIKNKITYILQSNRCVAKKMNPFSQFETLIKSNLLVLNEIDYETHLDA